MLNNQRHDRRSQTRADRLTPYGEWVLASRAFADAADQYGDWWTQLASDPNLVEMLDEVLRAPFSQLEVHGSLKVRCGARDFIFGRDGAISFVNLIDAIHFMELIAPPARQTPDFGEHENLARWGSSLVEKHEKLASVVRRELHPDEPDDEPDDEP